MNRHILKETLAFLCFAAALAAFVWFSSTVLMPHRTDYGSTWGAFSQEQPHSLDAVFFGSSITYCDIIPAVIYEQTGVTSYVLAGPEQTLPMTYYYLKEMYRSQSPALVLVEVTGMYYPQYTNFTKVNIGYMPWSTNRLAATLLAAEPEERLGLLFPLYNYHERWREPEYGNLRYPPDNFAGYTLLTEANHPGKFRERQVAFDQTLYNSNVEALRKIAALCQEQGSQVLFFIAPTYYPWESGFRELISVEAARIAGVDFIDFNSVYDDLRIDVGADYFDLLHFNIRGAEKFSAYLAGVISGYISEPRSVGAETWRERVTIIRDILAEN